MLLANVDAQYKFVAIDVGSYGREGDAGKNTIINLIVILNLIWYYFSQASGFSNPDGQENLI